MVEHPQQLELDLRRRNRLVKQELTRMRASIVVIEEQLELPLGASRDRIERDMEENDVKGL